MMYHLNNYLIKSYLGVLIRHGDLRDIMNKKHSIYIVFLIIGIAFYVINYLTSEFVDDFTYKMFDVDNRKTIESFDQYLSSTFDHYFVDNGRAVVHAVVRIFTVYLGKGFFNFANTFIFIILIFLLSKFYSEVKASNICFCAACVFLLFPQFNLTILWMDGSFNYLWPATFVLLYLIYIQKALRCNLAKGTLIGLTAFSFLVGATQEGITFPLSLSLLVFFAINYKRLKNNATSILLFAFVLGSFVCSLCPATLARGSFNNGQPLLSLLTSKIITGIWMVTELRAFYILLTIIFILWIRKGRDYLFSIYKKDIYMILFNAWLLSFGIIFGSGFSGTRVAIGEEFYSLLLILLLLSNFSDTSIKKVQITICILAIILYITILFYSIPNYKNSVNMTNQIKNGKNPIILAETVKKPDFLGSYILEPFNYGRGAYSYENIHNIFIAISYHKDSLAFLPRNIYDDVLNNNSRIYDIKKQHDYKYYIIPLDSWNNKLKASFILTPTNYSALPFYIRPFAPHMTQYAASEVEVNSMSIITIDNKPYLCIDKNPLIDNRLKEIRIEN